MKGTQLLFFGSLFILILVGCREEEGLAELAFEKIYDHSDASVSFHPVDFTPLTEGFLILAEKSNPEADFAGVSLHQINAEGNYVRELDLSADYVIPTGQMNLIDSVAYFVGMDPVSLEAILIAVNTDFRIVNTPLGKLYPLAINWTTDNELILLSYDPEDLQTELSIYDIVGSEVGSVAYTIGPGSEVVNYINAHYLDRERSRLPFFCGEWSAGGYYFNGFYNYNLSLVFSDLSNSPTGIVQGQGVNGGMSAIENISGSNFTAVGYQFQEVFVSPIAALSTGSISSSVDLMDTPISEFRARTPVSISPIVNGGQTYTVVAAETESRQIALYFYNSNGQLSAIQKIGYINPYTVSSIKSDEEGNLYLIGTTYVGGRFERLYFQKINQSRVSKWLN